MQSTSTAPAATIGTPVTYQWSVSGAAGQSASNAPVFHVALPTTVKTSVTVSVVVTFSDGCSSSGSLSLTTSDPELAELGRHLCEFLRSERLRNVLFPWQIPPDPARRVRVELQDLPALKQLTEGLLRSIDRVSSR